MPDESRPPNGLQRTEACLACGKQAPVDEHESLRCPECSDRTGTFFELFVDLSTGGPLSDPNGGDEAFCRFRSLIRERYGSFDISALNALRDDLVRQCGLTRDEVQVTRLERIVEWLKSLPMETALTRPITKAEAACAMNGGIMPANPSEKIKGLIEKRTLTPGIGEGRYKRYRLSEFPADERDKLR